MEKQVKKNKNIYREEVATYVDICRHVIDREGDGRENEIIEHRDITGSSSATDIEKLQRELLKDKEIIWFQTYQNSTIHLEDGRTFHGSEFNRTSKTFITDNIKPIPDFPMPTKIQDLEDNDKIFGSDDKSLASALRNAQRRSEIYSTAQKAGKTHYFKTPRGEIIFLGPQDATEVIDRSGKRLWPSPSVNYPSVRKPGLATGNSKP
jgi:hypothetical protein